jgi:hypothetical protein
MTMAKKAKPTDEMQPNNALLVEQSPNETGAMAMARKVLDPGFRHAVTASSFSGKVLGNSIEHPGLMDYVHHVLKIGNKAEAGDLAIASRLLASQAITLDSMFTELARRTALNMGEYISAAERYGRLALKAQSNCRATLEALAKLHQPREQIVKHVHVNEGGQAVVADEFHHHAGGQENAKKVEQSHTAGTARDGTPLLSHDTEGDNVPISSGEGQASMQDARRD